MKKIVLALTLVFAAGLFSTTALALNSTKKIEVVKGDKDKKKKKNKKGEAKSCSSASGEKKSCCSAGGEKK